MVLDEGLLTLLKVEHSLLKSLRGCLLGIVLRHGGTTGQVKPS